MKNIIHYEQIKALSKISNAISSDLYLDDILKLIVTVTAEMMGSKICSLMLVNEKEKTLELRATQSISEKYNKRPPFKIGEGIAGKVAQENKPVAVKDVTSEKGYKDKEMARHEKLCSLLCVPMSIKGKVIGVINCYTSAPHDFNEIEIDALVSIANQAAIAIENTELMVRTKIMQEELKTRKLLERAKGILMQEKGFNEEQAYLKIQKISMDSRKSIREVAEALIITAKMRHGE